MYPCISKSSNLSCVSIVGVGNPMRSINSLFVVQKTSHLSLASRICLLFWRNPIIVPLRDDSFSAPNVSGISCVVRARASATSAANRSWTATPDAVTYSSQLAKRCSQAVEPYPVLKGPGIRAPAPRGSTGLLSGSHIDRILEKARSELQEDSPRVFDTATTCRSPTLWQQRPL
jgi:hypothetical protein